MIIRVRAEDCWSIYGWKLEGRICMKMFCFSFGLLWAFIVCFGCQAIYCTMFYFLLSETCVLKTKLFPNHAAQKLVHTQLVTVWNLFVADGRLSSAEKNPQTQFSIKPGWASCFVKWVSSMDYAKTQTAEVILLKKSMDNHGISILVVIVWGETFFSFSLNGAVYGSVLSVPGKICPVMQLVLPFLLTAWCIASLAVVVLWTTNLSLHRFQTIKMFSPMDTVWPKHFLGSKVWCRRPFSVANVLGAQIKPREYGDGDKSSPFLHLMVLPF